MAFLLVIIVFLAGPAGIEPTTPGLKAIRNLCQLEDKDKSIRYVHFFYTGFLDVKIRMFFTVLILFNQASREAIERVKLS